MNTKVKEVFKGKVVNKALTLNTGVDEFPRYVLEYLIDNYCAEETFHEDMQKVVRRLKESFVYGAEAEKIRHFIRENRNHTLISSLEARLVETEDKYWGTIASINEQFVHVPQNVISQYPMLLAGGMWGTIDLTYDETEIHNKKIRPFKVTNFTPFQVSVINVDEFIEKRSQFSADEWIDLLVNSCGLNPERMDRREKLLYLARCVPLVETNHNMIELAPRETGKTYLYRNISYYARVLSGGKASPAQLFINLNNGKIGEVGVRDAVVFDEIANTDFTDEKSFVSIMQGYMQDSKFSRGGRREVLAFGSLVFLGNLDVQSKQPHEKYRHLFEPLPEFLQVIAFLDRIHAYLPGWEIPKLRPDSYSKDYGFIADYFCEIMHELRKKDVLAGVRSRFDLYDAAGTSSGISGRDQRAVLKTAGGLLKLLYPDGQVSDEQLGEVLEFACELRQRVREQMHLMAPGEYEPVKVSARLKSGRAVVPRLPEGGRVQRVTLPPEPSVGQVIGLAVEGDRGCILHFEMQATKGSGRTVPLGSIQRVMRESIEAAAQYIRAKHQSLGITEEWRQNYDVAILATYMGIPKEGPSAGITLVTGIVSALTNRRVRNDLAMTGEITIMGKVLPVGGAQEKIRAAVEAGIKEVLIPQDNLTEAQSLPKTISEKVTITPVQTIEQVLSRAFAD